MVVMPAIEIAPPALIVTIPPLPPLPELLDLPLVLINPVVTKSTASIVRLLPLVLIALAVKLLATKVALFKRFIVAPYDCDPEVVILPLILTGLWAVRLDSAALEPTFPEKEILFCPELMVSALLPEPEPTNVKLLPTLSSRTNNLAELPLELLRVCDQLVVVCVSWYTVKDAYGPTRIDNTRSLKLSRIWQKSQPSGSLFI